MKKLLSLMATFEPANVRVVRSVCSTNTNGPQKVTYKMYCRCYFDLLLYHTAWVNEISHHGVQYAHDVTISL